MAEEPASFVDQLAEVSRRQGRPFIDPTRIQGFGEPGDSPAPPLPPDSRIVDIPTAAQIFGGPGVDVPEEPPIPTPPPVMADSDELVIVEKAASYRRRGVVLNEEEKAGIITIVLKALRRDLDSQFREVAGVIPRRKRTVKAKLGRPPKEKS